MKVLVRALLAAVLVATVPLAPANADDPVPVRGCSTSHGFDAGITITSTPPYVEYHLPGTATSHSCSYRSNGGNVGWWCNLGPAGDCTITIVTLDGERSGGCSATTARTCSGVLGPAVPGSLVRVTVRNGEAKAWDCSSFDPSGNCTTPPDFGNFALL